MLALLRTFSWQELRHHPWRNFAAALAVALGVALAFSVHLINQSALSEFSSAVRNAGAQPDLELRGVQGRLADRLFDRIATSPAVALASPVLEISTFVQTGNDRAPVRVVGLDALSAALLSPALLPVPSAGSDRFAVFAPGAVFLNPAAQQLLGWQAGHDTVVHLQRGLGWVDAHVAGTVSAGGPPLAVMDIGAAQDLFGADGELTRIDVRLAPGVGRASFEQQLALPADVRVAEPGDAAQRVGSLSRAYRVNLTVLALVALFTGAFLVFSVLSLSVARRAQQFALLGVLGLTARQRAAVVLVESALLGLAGSIAGVALGTALAQIGLRVLGGDLGGGYFPGVAPTLQWSTAAALGYAFLGTVAAVAGGWFPARGAQQLPLAQTLKGLGAVPGGARRHLASVAIIVVGLALAALPPVSGLPLGAYASVALLLLGGITGLPAVVGVVYDRIAPFAASHALPLLAIERARRVRESAAVAVSGVVASLSLAVALTIMVASFRSSVAHWLDTVLPADLYVRTAISASASDAAWLSPTLVQDASRLPAVRHVATQRVRTLLLDPARPPVVLLARDVGDAARALPLVTRATPAPAGTIPVYVSEAMVDLYGAKPGTSFAPLAAAFPARQPPPVFFVAGVWRDYVRQTGAITMDAATYERLTGDRRVNDLQLWLEPGADVAQVEQAIRGLARRDDHGAADLLEFASAQQLREASLRIFDRSFAVTYWLQAVAIGIGLFGVAASFSAQVLARRKEFGLLAHLGLTRAQVLRVVAGEGAAWTGIGSIAGLLLGLAVAVVLVRVVNPQSFHWTMDLLVPWLRVALLCAAVVASGTVTAWLAGRAAAGEDAVLAVKEDW